MRMLVVAFTAFTLVLPLSAVLAQGNNGTRSNAGAPAASKTERGSAHHGLSGGLQTQGARRGRGTRTATNAATQLSNNPIDGSGRPDPASTSP